MPIAAARSTAVAGRTRPVEVLVQLGLRERTQGIDGDHRAMIGIRAAISIAVTLVGLVVLIGPRDADPAAGIAAERLVRERAQVATDALDTLRAAIQPGLDDARRAAAAVLSADEPPGSLLVEAGESIAAADEAAVTARRAVASLNGARSALGRRPRAVGGADRRRRAAVDRRPARCRRHRRRTRSSSSVAAPSACRRPSRRHWRRSIAATWRPPTSS